MCTDKGVSLASDRPLGCPLPLAPLVSRGATPHPSSWSPIWSPGRPCPGFPLVYCHQRAGHEGRGTGCRGSLPWAQRRNWSTPATSHNFVLRSCPLTALLQPPLRAPSGDLFLDHSWGSRQGWSPSEERLLLPGQRPTAAGVQTLGQGSCPGLEAILAPGCLPKGTETSPTRRLRRYGTLGTSHCREWGVFQAKPTCHPMRALNQGHII